MGAYHGYNNKTNTVSSTVPMFNLVGLATKRLRVFEILIGSDATPVDAASKFVFRRTSARGTQSTTVTPNPFDPADPAAGAVYDTAWSANPTITANSDMLQVAISQRNTVRWLARPECEIVIPATAGAGLALISDVATSAANHAFSAFWNE